MGKLDGQVAFITGGARGQGASHAKTLAREGADIVLFDICQDIPPVYPLATAEDLNRTAKAVEELGVRCLAIEGDVRIEAEVKDAVARAIDTFDKVDILVNNAGNIVIQGVDEITEDALDAVIDTNVKGIFWTTKHIVPGMKERGTGKIVNTSSAGGIKALPYVSPYAASKGAVVLATKSWANELAEWGINVNAVAPGTIKTGMISGLAEQQGKDVDEAFEEFNANNLFQGERGHVSAQDISNVILYLVSEESRMITGLTIPVDAGWTSS